MNDDVLLFPGHAIHNHEELQHKIATLPGVGEVTEAIDSAAAKFGLPPFFWANQLTADTPQHNDLASFVVSVAAFPAAAAKRSPILLGHSFGQLAALTCAEAFSIADAAQLLLYRNVAISTLAQGLAGMACIGRSAPTAERLALNAGRLSVACHNSPTQTVVAGPVDALARLRRRALRDDILYVRLPSRYAFHTPWAEPAAEILYKAASNIRQRPLRYPVYSATTSRFSTDADDFVAEMALDLMRPVYFLQAIEHLAATGMRTFVECGPGGVLTGLVRDTIPDAVCLRATELPFTQLPFGHALHPLRPYEPGRTLHALGRTALDRAGCYMTDPRR